MFNLFLSCPPVYHLPGTVKLFNLGDGKFRYGREKIICEKAKCIPLCPICHRKRHYGEWI